MVRETRHLWVGNLPDNIREDRIREHFKRYGRVQSVKLLARGGGGGGCGAAEAGGACAAVAFMDIKSAAKAHNSEKMLDERAYTTEYYEPAAIPPAATASAGSSPAGSSGGSVSSAPRYQHVVVASSVAEEGGSVAAAVGSAALAGGAAAAAAGAAAGSVAPWRGTNDSAERERDRDRDHYRRASATGGSTPVYCPSSQHPHYRPRGGGYLPPIISPGALDRTPHHRWYVGGETSAPSTPGGGAADGGGGGGGSTDGARRRRRSGSGAGSPPPPASSRSSSSSPEPSSDSRPSTPGGGAHSHTHSHSASHRHHRTDQWSSISGRALAICVRNLPARSSDSSLKDGLYHEYKKHGKVAWVKVVGASADRYAVVRFKKPSDVEKALEVSQDKLFFGCKISVAPHQGAGAELDDGEPARPYETDLDENHPKATRTLFIGNLEKDVTLQQLRDKFKHFGRIVEIDVKKQSGGAGYAFCQYASISSVVDAIRAMDGEYVGSSRVKLGFGKSMATTCVWIDGLTEHTEKQVLGVVSRCGTATSVCVDRSAGAALVHFEQAAAAAAAVRELRRVAAALAPAVTSASVAAAAASASPGAAAVAAAAPAAPPLESDQRRLMVDFASRDCQDAFYEQLEKHGGNGAAALAAAERLPGDLVPRYARHDSLSSRYEAGGSCRSRAASYTRSTSRTPRYAHSDHYDVPDYAADRRYRVYDEFGSSSPADPETLTVGAGAGALYEEARSLQSVVVASPRRRGARHHRRRSRDSTPDLNAKMRKDRRRSGGGCGGGRSELELRHRSRSGSRRRRTSEAERRRHRRRREHSGASSRAGTPLCDELPDGPAPAEPRRPPVPRDRSHPPMTLPLPKFAEQVLRSVAVVAPPPAPAPGAPASPPRAPSASSSSGGSAPHSPSLEERIRSLDEKYEKWSGSRAAAAEAAERGRLRHRLIDIDIKEVKPSEVVRSLLAKRSVFDEDSERLEGSAALDKCPSSPRAREPRVAPRALQYPFPTHPPLPPTSVTTASDDASLRESRQMTIEAVKSEFKKSFVECSDASADRDCSRTVVDSSDVCSLRPDGPRPNRTDSLLDERQYKLTEIDIKRDSVKLDPGIRLRTSSTDKSHLEPIDKKRLDKTDRDRPDHERDPRREADRRRLELSSKELDVKSYEGDCDNDCKDKNIEAVKINNCESELSSYDKMSSDIREQLKKDLMETVEVKKSSLEVGRNIGEQLKQENEIIGESNNKTNNECSDPIQHPELSKTNQEEVKCKFELVQLEKEPLEKHTKSETRVQDKDTMEKEKVEFERLKQERLEREEQDRTISETEKNEKDRIAKEKIEKDRTEKEKNEKEKLEKERIEKRRTENEKSEKERLGKEKDRIKSENEKLKEKEPARSRSSEEAEREKLDLEKLVIEREKKIKDDVEVTITDRDKLEEKEKQEKDRSKFEREHDRLEKDKIDKDFDKEKHYEDKSNRPDHKKEKSGKERRKDDHSEIDIFNHSSKSRKDEKYKHERHRKDHNDSRREPKKDSEHKLKEISRKSSRDESFREMQRKDSSDSTTSRASHDSTKHKDVDSTDSKDVNKQTARHKQSHDHSHKHKSEKETSPRNAEVKKSDPEKHNHERSKDPRVHTDHLAKEKLENHTDKQRHYSLDSQHVDAKRKERLNSSSSLPSNIGLKRRLSSQEILDTFVEETKKAKIEMKIPERRDSKDCKPSEKSKAFNKGHVAKLLESKIKDDKKNQVKTPDEKTGDVHDDKLNNDRNKLVKKIAKMHDEKSSAPSADIKTDSDSRSDSVSPRDIEFLATLELRSSEEDEKQKALRNEMKEKKRIQQLQQIQELQMQQDAMQQGDLNNKIKDEKRFKNEDRKKEMSREKRISTESKCDNKRRPQKTLNSSDTSDSDEPKKHSIFDIVDDGPTYISMYDKVKARSCKNMQKQEEEKRQEKIKAKFCQLKQSRAKREEKKRSTSWDGDSDSDQDPKKYSHKHHSMGSSSEDEHSRHHRRDNITDSENDYESFRKMEKLNYYNDSTNDEDARNKLSRKNSKSRIISDTSDDDSIKRNLNAHIENNVGIKKEIFSDTEIPSSDYFMKKEKHIKKEPYQDNIKREYDEKLTKQALINMFTDKFDALDENKMLKKEITGDNDILKPSIDLVKLEHEFKCNQLKAMCNDFSSEGELSGKFLSTEIRKKHKKKQKKEKSSLSEEDIKSTEYSEQSPMLGGEIKHRRNSEKSRKHNNKKDKRREKIRESLDGDDFREDKIKTKKLKKCVGVGLDSKVDSGSSTIRREEKMENIFGPLSDDSDAGPRTSNSNHNHNFGLNNLSSNVTSSINDKFDYITKNADDFMLKDKEKEESRRRKERKRKEKRYLARDDENSLDVDAAGKAIEASLFADSVPENENQNTKVELTENCDIKPQQDIFRYTERDECLETTLNNELKQVEKNRRETKEKKKKKKRNKEDRPSRHHHHDNSDVTDRNMNSSNKPSVTSYDSQAEKEANIQDKLNRVENSKTEDIRPALQSPSLPRLTDSPPPILSEIIETVQVPVTKPPSETGMENVSNGSAKVKTPVVIDDVKDIKGINSTLTSKKDNISSGDTLSATSKNCDSRKIPDTFIPRFGGDNNQNMSEDAVKSIAEFDKPKDPLSENKPLDSTCVQIKNDEKLEEKPRAVISQEETEDAVAALLGESFGGNGDSFGSCFDEVEDSSSAQVASTSMESENIPEEDAELRQAVQNLNASELEMKPDTPMSENDLQIDTDTEEQDDSQNENNEKVTVTSLSSTVCTPTNAVSESKSSEASSSATVNISPKPLNSDMLNKSLNLPPHASFGRFNDLTKSDKTQSDLIYPMKRLPVHQMTSTATPVISTAWSLAGNKLSEPHLINVNTNHMVNHDEKPYREKLTANIVHFKPTISQNITLNPQHRPMIGTQARITHPFIINQMIRPGHMANIQPPTITIPEPQILYQKQSGLVIPPQMMTGEVCLQSPKSSPQSDMSSPRMTILSPSPQSMNSIGLSSPTSLQQRSPGHVKVVRMQQPPLSPIQAIPLGHGNRAVVSPNRPNSVLVQTQAAPMHTNRLPVTPVLAPLSKPMHPNNVLQQPKGMMVNSNSTVLHPHKIITEIRKTDPRTVQDMVDGSKLVITPSTLQPSTNPTVMAQNRLIMQNAGLHLSNKILFSTAGHISEKRDLPFKSEISKPDVNNKPTYGQSPMLHIATMNQSTSTMIHQIPKPVISLGQEQYTSNRPHVSNVIHSVNSQRLLTTVAMTSVIQGDPNKMNATSVLSMTPLRTPGVVTRFDKPAHVSVTSSVLNNVVMTPSMVKNNVSQNTKPNNTCHDANKLEPRSSTLYSPSDISKDSEHLNAQKVEEKPTQQPNIPARVTMDTTKESSNTHVPFPTPPVDISNKCETDFEELLKDTTNEIKVTKDSGRKVEVNVAVGESVTSYSTNQTPKPDERNQIVDKIDHSKETVLDKSPIDKNSDSVTEKNDDSEGWSAKEVNIESVIKKVDDLCKNQDDIVKKIFTPATSVQTLSSQTVSVDSKNATDNTNISFNMPEHLNSMEVLTDPLAEITDTQQANVSKRGARNGRGKKSDKHQDRVQTRQISKPVRGSAAARRGRGGRTKVDKKSKTMSNSGPILSGDIYDFHEDSGDEAHTSPQHKSSESRPRLIITIKSPGTVPTSNIAVPSTVSITPREQPTTDKIVPTLINKEEKSEDFLSPAPNTRKSRRLQEKDGNRSTVDDVIDDVVKNASLQTKGVSTKEGNPRRTTRQAIAKTGGPDKPGMDVRKSPRGGKRTRDRSSSETSIDSSDEKTSKKDDESSPEPKVPKLTDATLVSEKMEVETCANFSISAPALPLPNNTASLLHSTPIMKPPKKMISEISAKLASTFEVPVSRPSLPVMPVNQETAISANEKIPEITTDGISKQFILGQRLEKHTGLVEIKMPTLADDKVRLTNMSETASRSASDLSGAELNFQRQTSASSSKIMSGRSQAPGEAVPGRSHAVGELAPPARSLLAGEPGRLLMSGVMEEADLRVQSPTLPHRPPAAHRPTDRATPILISRACESESPSLAALEACRASPARAGAVGAVGPGPGARAYRAPFAPSLPRGAHHPPPPPPPMHPALAAAAAAAAGVVARPLHQLKHAQPGSQSRVTLTSVPSVSPQGHITGEGMYPHFSHQHYKVYQQHFHATQHDSRASPSPYTRSLETEGSEAPAPPLELRRPPPSARVPRPAHSPSPADRLISGRGSPPPAHGGAGASRMPSALPPPGPAGPPHASQVPREADSLQMLLRRYPVMWQGLLALKNDGAAVQMHFVHGNPGVAGNTLPRHVDGSTPPLRIAQRMRLEPVQLEAVHRKMQMENEHCMLLALPCGRDHMDVLQQSTNLTSGFITYLQRKQAAGIVNVAPPGHNQAMYTVHIFPSCEFAKENLNRIAPDLLHRVADIAHLLIVIATV